MAETYSKSGNALEITLDAPKQILDRVSIERELDYLNKQKIEVVRQITLSEARLAEAIRLGL